MSDFGSKVFDLVSGVLDRAVTSRAGASAAGVRAPAASPAVDAAFAAGVEVGRGDGVARVLKGARNPMLRQRWIAANS